MRRKPHKYILDKNGRPVARDDLETWARWFEPANRRVAETTVGDLRVSTVFLGLDYAWADGLPILWETMIFDKEIKEKDCDRCSASREQAEAMHEKMVATATEMTNETKPS
jgi:hypothetical protein